MQNLAQRRKVCLKILTTLPSKEAYLTSPSSINISINIPSPKPADDVDKVGTKSIIDLQQELNVTDHHQYDTAKSNSSSSSPSTIENRIVNITSVKSTKRNNSRKKDKKVFPPPIRSLARTQNLASHMPWVLRRYYTKEGRLILKEEKVRHHEYFRVHRANGRLTLKLVPFDNINKEDDHHDNHSAFAPNKKFACENKGNIVGNEELLHGQNNNDNGGVIVGGNKGRLKCVNFNCLTSLSPRCRCNFGVKMHPFMVD
ncbi:hypothetical protein PIB30_068100 [Stylosanthes scabra]|uniref:FAF domain-containing protein n=1 Tax=Stylosanthes scabra TaxID=79078 RepID=A0ABU6VL72_9FABA|nr:hypothetical protein [Stylosanthes scabra]